VVPASLVETTHRALLLPVDRDLYAVALATVEEVVEPGRLTRVPGAPAATLGVLNVRGRVVPVDDLGRLLGLPALRRVAAVALVGTARGPAGLATDAPPFAALLTESLGASGLEVGAARWRVAERVATEIDVEAALAPERLG
jgi:purine-binding chemotaxis protein CheW